MADENTNIQQPGEEVTPESLGVTFEDILPWGSEGGDTGLSARLKLKRNFEKIKMWFDSTSITRLKELFLSKIEDDQANGMITFIKGLQVGDRFVTGLLGEGGVFRKEADGTTYLEADKLYIRIKAYFDNVEIRDFKHSAGNRIASPAGMKCCRVEWLDAGGDVVSQADANLPQVVKFRCYFRGDDGEDEVRNNFIVGDQAYCHITSVDTKADDPNSKGLNMKHYWRLVVGRNPSGTLTADGEHWIDLSNRSSETLKIDGRTYTHAGCQDGSDIPMTQDDIIQLGNIYDTDRMGAIIEFVTGADSPSYQIFQDINDFNLNSKNYIALGYSTQTGRAYLYVYGDTFIGDPEESTYIRYNAQTKKLDVKATVTFVSPTTHEDTTIEDFAAAVTSDINTIQNQIDGTIETWFYNGEPSDSTLPESQWKAIDEAAGNNNERLKHLGDMYYDNQTGYAYRYANQGTESQPQFVWTPISDSAVVKALADAAKAQDTADHKRRVFLTTPTPPYDAGDMWVNAVWPASGESQGSTYNNDILRCKTARTSTQSFKIKDWVLASKYTDDSAFNAYINQILNGSGASGDSATVANAIRTIKGALNEGTAIDGGLVLTSLLAMRSNNKVWAGISGVYNDSLATGGIAAWFGGAMKDKDVDVTATDCAKSLFRMDGSGYVANGNIAWDSTGLTTLNVSSVSADTIKLGGKGVATQDWVKQNYISIAYFDRLFRVYNGNNIVQHNDVESTIDNIKAMFGFWTDAYVSALGKGTGGGDMVLAEPLKSINSANLGAPTTANVGIVWNGSKWVYGSTGGGGGTDMATVWAELGASTSNQINASHLTNALGSYAQKTELAKYLPLTAGANNRITGILYLSRPVSTATEYTETDSRIYYTTPDSEDEILLRARIRNNGTNNYNRTYYITPFSQITSNDVAAGTQGYTTLSLGNSTLITAENSKCGRIILYGKSGTDSTNVYYGIIVPTVFSANRTYTLPDATGTIALTSNLDGYLPLTGGTLTGKLTINNNLEVSSASTFRSGFHIGNPNGHETQLYTADDMNCLIIKPIVSGSSDTFQLTKRSNGLSLDFVVHDSSGNTIGGLNMLQLSNASNWNIAYGSLSTTTGSTNINGRRVVIRTSSSTEEVAVENDGTVNIAGNVNIVGNVSAAKFIGDLQGNADSATTATAASKLSVVSKRAWGQTYWTSGGIPTNISGDMIGVGLISMSGSISGATTISADTISADTISADTSLSVDDIIIEKHDEINNYADGGVNLQYSSTKNVSLCKGGGKVAIGHDDPSYKLDVSGVIYSSTGVYSAGYVTALSDIRKKEIQGDVGLTVGDVANAPSVRFLWKDKRKDGMQVGSIAQYWQKVLPEAVINDSNGVLSMSYGVIALLASIATARKVQDHDRRISELESENKRLKRQLEDKCQ